MFEDDIQKKEELEKELTSLIDMVSTFKINLNNGHIDLNENIKEIIAKITYVGKLKKEVVLSKEENKDFETKFYDLKQGFTELKGRHLHKYNEKIENIKIRYSKLVQKIIDKDLDNNIKDRIKNIPKLSKSDVLINNSQWTQSRYLDTLEYSLINYVEKELTELENILKIKNDNLLELRSILEDVEEVVNTIKLNIDKGLTIENINIYLNEYPVLLNRLLTLETKHESLRNIISRDSFGIYSGRIVEVKNELTKQKERLLDEKKKLDEKNNIYNHLMDSLDVIYNEYKTLRTTIIDNKGIGSETLINALNNKLDSYFKNLEKVKEEIQKHIKDNKINQVQIDNLNNKISEIQKLHDDIDLKLNIELFVLSDEEKKNRSESNFYKVSEDLNQLRNLIDSLDTVSAKDQKKRENVELYIKQLNDKFCRLDGLLFFYEKYDVDKYNKIKNMYDKNKEEFDNLCKEYNGKCPLKVKMVRETKRVYKKHKKLSLISAGLASLTLLTSGYALVPALMHGNALLGKSVPAFNGMMTFFNKILGSLIGASVGKNGAWVLATGAVLNGSVATTSILKFLATIGLGGATLAAPLYIPQVILLVKQLVDKIKEYDLKQKLTNTYKTGVKKVNKTIEKVEKKISEYDLRSYYNDLLNDYLNFSNGMSLDEFCKKRKLSVGDREILESMVKLDNLITSKVGSNRVRRKGTAKFA